MPLKVTWKKGMRLSADVFNALDLSNEESVRLSNLVATGGRMGLISGNSPFELSVNVSNNILEVVSLSCHGVTKSGKMVDIEFDSNYTKTFDTRIAIPNANNDEAFLLIVKLHDKQWREVNEMYSEQFYTFELINENSPIGCDSLPIGCLVNQYGWRLDEVGYVPPCLYVNAHLRYVELVNRAKSVLKSISERCFNSQNCIARHLLNTLWTTVVDCYIDIDKSQEQLSPNELFAAIQKVVSSFVIGCSIDEYISLENADPFVDYHQKSYDGRNLYRDIQRGIELCSEIAIKMEAVCNMAEVREISAPSVEKPKQKSQPAPEQKSTGRNRWEGIEI